MNGMKKTTFTFLLLMLFGLGSKLEGAQISIGITIGRPPEPRAVRVLPRRPGPEFVWVEGYWYPDHKRYRWHDGYWTRPPYEGARWVEPRYEREVYVVGYWAGERGRMEHDHHWDRGREKDFDRDDRRRK
jgi:hypothetical protein